MKKSQAYEQIFSIKMRENVQHEFLMQENDFKTKVPKNINLMFALVYLHNTQYTDLELKGMFPIVKIIFHIYMLSDHVMTAFLYVNSRISA